MLKTILFAALSVFSAQVFAQKKQAVKTREKTDERIILTVENEKLTVGEFIYAYTKNNPNKDRMWEENSIREYLKLFSEFKMKVLEAKRLKYDTAASFREEFEKFKEQLSKPYMTERNVTEQLVKEAYDRLHEQIRAAHILIMVKPYASPQDTLAAYEKMKNIRKQALSGVDFGELAAKHSEDPSAVNNKGDLGYFTALQMVYPFENVAYKTPKGKVSEIFRTKFGYHILKVSERRANEGNVKIAHIMIRANEGIPAEDSIAAVVKIFEIEKKLKEGADWYALCRNFSDDLKTRNEGGELPPYAAGTMLPEFEDVVFKLRNKGEFSAPVRTKYGWHILKLMERTPLQTFEELKDILKEKVSRDSRAELQEELFIARLKKDNNFKAKNTKKIQKLIASYADSLLLRGKWKFDRNDGELSSELFSIRNKPYTLKDFFIFAEANQTSASNFDNAEAYLTALYDDFVNTSLREDEFEQLSEKYPEYRYLLSEYHDGILLFELMSRSAWQKAPTDAAGMEKYFEENRDKYRWKERANIAFFSAADTETINIVKKELERGYFPIDNPNYEKFVELPKFKMKGKKLPDEMNFDFQNISALLSETERQKSHVLVIAAAYTNDTEGKILNAYLNALQAQIESRKIEKDRVITMQKQGEKAGILYKIHSRSLAELEKRLNKDKPLCLRITEELLEPKTSRLLDKIEWKKGMYEFADENRHMLAIVREIVPPQNKELPEVKGAVISDYQKYLEENLLKELRERYKVTVYDHIVKELAGRK
jgi:peptidyl-prolyl cis-trans isomerase SurA